MSFSFLVFLGFLPSLAWLFFFLKEDIHPEPRKMVIRVFMMGALVTLLAIAIQLLLFRILNIFNIRTIGLFPFFAFAAVEETLKFLAAYWIIRKSKFFDEAVDAMIYLIAASLGFALIENISVLTNVQVTSEAFGIITLRFVGATLLHALSSAIVGYYWARGIMISRLLEQPNNKERNFIIKGIFIASILHTIFNYFILVFNEVLIYPTVFLAIIALFVFWDFEKIKMRSEN